jgi:4-hydroxybenzoate polyprenyltransferase
MRPFNDFRFSIEKGSQFMTPLKEYLAIVRIDNWLGWIFSFEIGSVFLSLPSPKIITLLFLAFSFATAGIFILNQYFDREDDKENTEKSVLPIASGRIAPRTALILSLSLMASSLLLAFSISMSIFQCFLSILPFGLHILLRLFGLRLCLRWISLSQA